MTCLRVTFIALITLCAFETSLGEENCEGEIKKGKKRVKDMYKKNKALTKELADLKSSSNTYKQKYLGLKATKRDAVPLVQLQAKYDALLAEFEEFKKVNTEISGNVLEKKRYKQKYLDLKETLTARRDNRPAGEPLDPQVSAKYKKKYVETSTRLKQFQADKKALALLTRDEVKQLIKKQEAALKKIKKFERTHYNSKLAAVLKGILFFIILAAGGLGSAHHLGQINLVELKEKYVDPQLAGFKAAATTPAAPIADADEAEVKGEEGADKQVAAPDADSTPFVKTSGPSSTDVKTPSENEE